MARKKLEEPAKIGRPSITIDPVQVEKLASYWMTKDAIADFLGIARATFYNKMRDDPEIETSFLRGRASLQRQSVAWLRESAENGNVRAQIELAKGTGALRETITHEHEIKPYVVELPAEVPLQDWQGTFRPRDPDAPEPGELH